MKGELILNNLKKRILSIIFILSIVLSCINITSIYADSDFVCGGWFETIYAEWKDTDVSKAVVEYKKSGTSDYILVDAELIRAKENGTGRVDIVGLESGNYDIKITSGSEVVYSKENIAVKAYDRAGFAHKDYSQGVGAYKNDGTPKDNAIIVYVTNENKDTIVIPGYEEYGTGIGWLLNNNREFPEKLALENKPLIVRFVGKVLPPDGLTQPASIVNGGNVKDNGFMCIIKSSKNITLEGIGDDAAIEGWGFSFFVGAGYKNYESYEVRNLSFSKYPEDALGFQGEQSTSKADTAVLSPIEHVWVHNCSFDTGFCANPTESDKHEGDGSCDFKRGQYYTMAYNYYKNCHKTNLVGASDENLQYHMTFHHNYYEDCDSRAPLARRADIHIYNSYFKGNTSKTVDARANSFIFSEANFYDSCKNPIVVKSGAVVKSYNDTFYNTIEANQGTFVTDKSQTVKSACKYENFDTKPDFYEYTITDAAQARADCIAYSGVMKKISEIIENENPKPSSVIPVEPLSVVKLPVSVTFDNSSANDYFGNILKDKNIKQLEANQEVSDITDGIIYKPAGKYSQTATAYKFKDQGIVFKIDKKSVIGIESKGGSYPAVLYDSDGKDILSAKDSKKFAVLEPGVYMVQSGLSTKEAYLSFISLKEYTDGEEIPTNSENTTENTTQSDIEDTTEDTSNDDDDNGDDDFIDDTASVHILDYTNNINTNNFFDFSGKQKTDKKVMYNGKELTKSLNMESKTYINFTTKEKGTISLVMFSTNSAPKVKIDGNSVAVLSNEVTTFEIEPGSHSITKDTTDTYLFLINVSENKSETSTETTYETSTETTSETESIFKFDGDVDESGDVNAEDAAKVLNYVLNKKKYPLSAEQIEAAKIEENEDIITARNAAYILEYALGHID